MSLGSLRFALFVVLTGVLFMRPSEIISDLAQVPLYEGCIYCCLAISLPNLVAQLSRSSLAAQPITLCVFGLQLALPLSLLSHLAFEEAIANAFQFFKIVISYLLLVSAVNTTTRLRLFLGWLGLFILVLTVLGMLHYFGVIDIQALDPVLEKQDDESGDQFILSRLCGAGIFANPNNLSRILVVGMAICLYGLGERDLKGFRYLCLAPLAFFGYALILTYSRGGFIGLLVTLLVLFQTRFGTWKTIALVALVVPVFFAAKTGRQMDFDTGTGTGQERIQVWSAGLEAFRTAPVFGIGIDRYPEITGGLAAHNSYVHSYVELGFVGGTLFAGAVALALWGVYRLGASRKELIDPQLLRLRPYLVAINAGYAAGMFSSSRCYDFTTYYLLGLAAVYLNLALPQLPDPMLRVSPRLLLRLVLLSFVFLACIQVYVWMSARWH